MTFKRGISIVKARTRKGPEGRSSNARLDLARIGLILAVVVLVSVAAASGAEAQTSFRLVPGLVHGTAPHVVVDQFVPNSSLLGGLDGFASSNQGASRGCGVSVTGSQSATSAPVGLTSVLATNDDPNCHDFWGSDKWRHIGVWFAGTAGFYLLFKHVFKTSKLVSYLLSATVMTGVGIAREISDSNSEKNCFSEQDLFANTIGILTAGVVIAIF